MLLEIACNASCSQVYNVPDNFLPSMYALVPAQALSRANAYCTASYLIQLAIADPLTPIATQTSFKAQLA